MKKSLALFLGLAFVFSSAVAFAADDVQDTPLYGESLAQAKTFSAGDDGIQPKYVKGASDAMQAEYPWPTAVGTYTCAVAMPTCVEYPTCCWENLTCQSDGACVSTLDWSPTCEQATCLGAFTCLSGQWTCDAGPMCEPAATMYGFLTCGWWPTCWLGPTCTGNYTCGTTPTCGGHRTCNRLTVDSNPTCGPKPTCSGETCWPEAGCEATYEPQLTCQVGFTCETGPTCQQGTTTCDITCSPELLTCQGAYTCWADEECQQGDEWLGVPGLSPIGTAVLVLSLASLVVLFMYKRKKANQEV